MKTTGFISIEPAAEPPKVRSEQTGQLRGIRKEHSAPVSVVCVLPPLLIKGAFVISPQSNRNINRLITKDHRVTSVLPGPTNLHSHLHVVIHEAAFIRGQISSEVECKQIVKENIRVGGR